MGFTPEPSDRRLAKRNMCDGKKRHHAPHLAQRQIDAMIDDTSMMNIYRCFYCGKYHVGHLIKD